MPTDLFINAVEGNNSTLSGRLRWKYWIGVALLLCITLFGAYGRSFSNPFHYDDLHSIRDNPHIRTVENIPQFFYRTDYFSADSRGRMYRPIVLVSYACNYALDKLQVQSYHWVNVGIHALNSGLLVALARLLLGGWLAPLLAGLLFALHPVNGEVVNYISSRSESLCSAFFLVSFIAYIQAHRAISFRVPFFGLSLLAFIGALLCKSVAVTLVPLLVLYEWHRGGSSQALVSLIKRLSPFLLSAVVYVIGMRQLLHVALVDAPVRDGFTQWATQLKALVYYAKLLAFPWGLNVEHPFTLGHWQVAVGLSAVFLLMSALAIWRRGPLARGMLLWFLLVLAPTFFVPLNVLVNEHRLYIPSAAFALGLAMSLRELLVRTRWGIFVLGCCLLAYAGIDIQRTAQWSSAETLWGASLAHSSQMPRPHIYMANALRENGRNREALESYRTALVVYPAILSGGDRLSIHNNMGAVYLAMERIDESIEAYRQALQIDPHYLLAQQGLEGALALRDEQRQAGALALQKQGLLALVEGNVTRAVTLLQQSVAERPLGQTYLVLAQAYQRLGDEDGMRQAYVDLIAIDPQAPLAERARMLLRTLEERAERP
jgi:tetratricopeptide (TPR) repeat protein